ncbi:hypothetical protein BGX27_004861, partial [Mortierella sp. AM989]
LPLLSSAISASSQRDPHTPFTELCRLSEGDDMDVDEEERDDDEEDMEEEGEDMGEERGKDMNVEGEGEKGGGEVRSHARRGESKGVQRLKTFSDQFQKGVRRFQIAKAVFNSFLQQPIESASTISKRIPSGVRAYVAGRANAGQKLIEIAKELEMYPSTVSQVIKTVNGRGTQY